MNTEFFTLPLINMEGTVTYLIDFEFQYPSGSRVTFLNHPMAPNVYLKIESNSYEALQGMQVQTAGKSDCQKQLEFCRKFDKYLSYEETLKLRSICESFIINRGLSNEHKKSLSDLCGIVAKIHLNQDIKLAIRVVNDNSVLLDGFNRNWYNNLKAYFTLKKEVDSRGKRATIFNMAGFLLAQLENI